MDRESILSSVVELYSVNTTVDEFPLRVRFKGEKAIDVGGVFRDMLSAFWETFQKLHSLFFGYM